MADGRIKSGGIGKIGETLAGYALDSADLNLILEHVHPEAGINRDCLAYEMKLLKIISVGWGLTFFGAEHPAKAAMTAAYWSAINLFSRDISVRASAAVGKKIDYFEILKARTADYVCVLRHSGNVSDPVIVIGPKLAELCGDRDNIHLVMAGNRTFSYALKAVRDYLESV